MKHPIKIGIIAVGLLLVTLGVGSIPYIDRLARLGVEHGATYALGVPTRLGQMGIGLFSGRVSMNDLLVSNPDVYRTPHFLKMNEGGVAVSLGSLKKDTVELPELTLRGLNMHLERRQGTANYKTILENLEKLSPSEQAPAEPQGPSKEFVIRKVSIEDITDSVQLASIGGDLTNMPVRIEKIELVEVGSKGAGGVQISELASIVTKAILTAVVQKAGDVLPAGMSDELSAGLGKLGKLGNIGGATARVIGDVTAIVGGEKLQFADEGRKLLEGTGERATEKVDEAREKLREGVGGLFGKKKNDDD